MALVNKAVNEITLKLVYYGPGLCGKTTNLERIHGDSKLQNKGKLLSMSTETDRTLFFDFMPMELGTVRGQKIRVQLYTVPGQVFYNATRKLVLRGADGVVFVADSQPSMRESNIESLLNLRENLRINRLDPDKIPVVFQYNKRDLPTVDPVEVMTGYLKPGESAVIEAAAIENLGVRETLQKAVSAILHNIRNNVDVSLKDEAEMESEPIREPEPVGADPISRAFAAPASPPAPAAAPAPSRQAGGAATAAEPDDLPALLEETRRMIAALESALTSAREQERRIAAALARR
ncbi:MAG TPA: GTPase domain-containing protein [Thermoanaerobaculia bacterium]|nr:GTPase domain-containing protein [Thermoanaerobaculia bacterium]